MAPRAGWVSRASRAGGRGLGGHRAGGVRLGADHHAGRGARRRRRGRARRGAPARRTSTSSPPAGSSCRASTPLPTRDRAARSSASTCSACAPRAPRSASARCCCCSPSRGACGASRSRCSPALLLVGQRFFIHLSRAGYHYVDTPFVSLLAVWLFLRLWQDGRLGAAVWCGIVLGLGIQTYYASRLVPLLLALTWLCWLRGDAARPAPRRRARRVPHHRRHGARRRGADVRLLRARLGRFWERTRDTSIFSAGAAPPPGVRLPHRQSADDPADPAPRGADVSSISRATTRCSTACEGALLRPGERARCSSSASAGSWRDLRERRAQIVLLWTRAAAGRRRGADHRHPLLPAHQRPGPVRRAAVALALWACAPRSRAPCRDRARRRRRRRADRRRAALIFAENLRTYFVDYAPRYRHSPASRSPPGCARTARARRRTWSAARRASTSATARSASSPTATTRATSTTSTASCSAQRFDPARSAVRRSCRTARTSSPRLEQAVGPFDLQTHRNRDGDVAFLDARFRADRGNDAARPARPLRSAARCPARGIASLDARAACSSQTGAPLAAGGAAGAALLAWRWSAGGGRPRRPGVVGARACRSRERAARWRAALGRPRRARAPRRPAARRVFGAAGSRSPAARSACASITSSSCRRDSSATKPATATTPTRLLHTGRDETGARWPLYVWSFGVSYKNPVFIYSAMLPMARARARPSWRCA